LAEALARLTGATGTPDWDEMTQAALAAAALGDAAGQNRGPDGTRPVDEIFRDLAYPLSYESPERYDPRAKAGGDAEDLRARLVKVLQELAR
jgi:hypothetical protein